MTFNIGIIIALTLTVWYLLVSGIILVALLMLSSLFYSTQASLVIVMNMAQYNIMNIHKTLWNFCVCVVLEHELHK